MKCPDVLTISRLPSKHLRDPRMKSLNEEIRLFCLSSTRKYIIPPSASHTECTLFPGVFSLSKYLSRDHILIDSILSPCNVPHYYSLAHPKSSLGQSYLTFLHSCLDFSSYNFKRITLGLVVWMFLTYPLFFGAFLVLCPRPPAP